jgi:AcrR family transcriptional regulator
LATINRDDLFANEQRGQSVREMGKLEAGKMKKRDEKQENDRRSQRTRRFLTHALLQLMLEKRYDKITVQDIIDRANVGRSTFYAHYLDKEDLLTSQFEEVLDYFSHHLEVGEGNNNPRMSVKALFRHAQEFQPVYNAMVWGRGIELLYQQGQAFLCKRIEADLAVMAEASRQPTVPTTILATYIASTLVTLLRWWLENKMPYSVERMDEIFQQLVMPSVQSAFSPSTQA